MRQLFGRICIFLGIVLLVAALALLCYNTWESQQAMEASDTILTTIQQTRDETPMESSDASETPSGDPLLIPFDSPVKEMTVVEVNGYDYIGTLSIPILGLELPVMSELDYPRLRISPCRQNGSVYTDDLVIAAHNYNSHFGKLSQLRPDDLLTFTDMEGVAHLYHIEAIDVLEPTAVDAVLSSPFDLVLYTCTYGGEKRVAVFCNRVLL